MINVLTVIIIIPQCNTNVIAFLPIVTTKRYIATPKT